MPAFALAFSERAPKLREALLEPLFGSLERELHLGVDKLIKTQASNEHLANKSEAFEQTSHYAMNNLFLRAINDFEKKYLEVLAIEGSPGAAEAGFKRKTQTLFGRTLSLIHI